jgi:DNA-binding response OmpR family regulator
MIVTTETDPKGAEEAAKLGANLYTTKPVRADLLLAQVRALVGPPPSSGMEAAA